MRNIGRPNKNCDPLFDPFCRRMYHKLLPENVWHHRFGCQSDIEVAKLNVHENCCATLMQQLRRNTKLTPLSVTFTPKSAIP